MIKNGYPGNWGLFYSYWSCHGDILWLRCFNVTAACDGDPPAICCEIYKKNTLHLRMLHLAAGETENVGTVRTNTFYCVGNIIVTH